MEEGVEATKVFPGGWVEALDQGGDVLGAGSVEVEQERWVRAGLGQGGEREAFRGPAFRILVRSVLGSQELGEECRYRPCRIG